MNYISLINSFWYSASTNPLSTGQVSLYFALLHICNSSNWTEWFQAPNQVLSVLTGMSRSGILKARNELKQRGMIDFRERGTKTTLYKITIANSVQVGEQNGVQKGVQKGEQNGVQKSSTLKDIEKEKEKNRPLISPCKILEQFLLSYPLPAEKINRHLTEIAYIDCLMMGHASEEQLLAAAKNYGEKLRLEGRDKDYRFIKNPENFLRDLTYCQYLPGVYEKPRKQPSRANQGMLTYNYGDMVELERELLSN